jgi:hypothetical protein
MMTLEAAHCAAMIADMPPTVPTFTWRIDVAAEGHGG